VKIVLLFILISECEAEEFSFYGGYYRTIVNLDAEGKEIGVRYGDWDLQIAETHMGRLYDGSKQGTARIYSGSYLFQSDQVPIFGRLGISYTPGQSELVGPTNFRLGVGIRPIKNIEIEYAHYSSADIHPTNTGLDMLIVRYKF
jgi:hypothetical protein